jgi:hypothetical protein
MDWDSKTDPKVIAWMAEFEVWRAELRAFAAAREAAWRSEAAHPLGPPPQRPRTDDHLTNTATQRDKLTEDDVRSIRRRHAAGEGRNALAERFGVSTRAINRIAARQLRANVPD